MGIALFSWPLLLSGAKAVTSRFMDASSDLYADKTRVLCWGGAVFVSLGTCWRALPGYAAAGAAGAARGGPGGHPAIAITISANITSDRNVPGCRGLHLPAFLRFAASSARMIGPSSSSVYLVASCLDNMPIGAVTFLMSASSARRRVARPAWDRLSGSGLMDVRGRRADAGAGAGRNRANDDDSGARGEEASLLAGAGPMERGASQSRYYSGSSGATGSLRSDSLSGFTGR